MSRCESRASDEKRGASSLDQDKAALSRVDARLGFFAVWLAAELLPDCRKLATMIALFARRVKQIYFPKSASANPLAERLLGLFKRQVTGKLQFLLPVKTTEPSEA